MQGRSGLLLIGIGVIHTAFGVFQGSRMFSRLAQATFPTDAGRQLVTGLARQYVFWFLFGGFMMLLLGHLLMWSEHRGRRVPSFVGWELIALSLVGVALMPASGFWLVLALGIYIIVLARRARSIPEAPAL